MYRQTDRQTSALLELLLGPKKFMTKKHSFMVKSNRWGGVVVAHVILDLDLDLGLP